MVAAGQRVEVPVPGAEQVAGPRRGEAGQHGEPERPAHHEGGVDDAGGQAGVARVDVTHRRQQHRVEGDARRRSRAGSCSAARRSRSGRRPARGRTAPVRPRPAAGRTTSGRLIPKRITSLADRPSENAPMIRLAGRNASPTCSGRVARARAAGRGRRGRTRRTSPPPTARRRRWRWPGCAGGTVRAAPAARRPATR